MGTKSQSGFCSPSFSSLQKKGKATFLHRMSLQTRGSFNCFHNLAVNQTGGGTCHVEKEEAMYLIVFIHVFLHGLQYIHVLLMDEILHGLG